MQTIHIQHATIHVNGGIPGQLLQLPVRTAEGFASALDPVTPPALGELWEGQGGRYIGILPAIGERPAQYMVASDEETRAKWGSYSEVNGARSRHDGRANTAALIELVAAGTEHEAAAWCSAHRGGGHADWHLPSQAELFLASLYAPQVFEKEGWYWSSTQNSRLNAFIQDFEDGYSLWHVKDLDFRVRAVRWIQLQPLNA